MNLTDHRKPTVIFAVAAVILMAVGMSVVLTTLRFFRDNDWESHTATVLNRVDALSTLERTAIAAQRGYLLTGSKALRDDFWESKAALPERLRALKGMIQYAPVAKLLDQVAPTIEQRISLAANTINVYERRGLPAAQAYIETNGSLAMDVRIQAVLEEMRVLEEASLSARRATAERSANRLLLASTLGIPLSLLMLAVVYRLLLRENRDRRTSEQSARDSEARLRKLSGDMEALSRYTGMLQTCDGAAELLALTRQALAGLAPSLSGTVYLIRASRDHAEASVNWGQHLATSDVLPLPSDCWAVRRNKSYCCHDVAADIRCAHVELPQSGVAVATLCLPLTAQGELMGWWYLSGRGPGPLPDFDLVLSAAEQFSLALANVRLREDLRHQSIRDALTGLYNRRYLEASLAREIARCERSKLPLVVLMFDLDNFKAFNDQHGHPGGDALLSAFGRLLQSHCRPEDIACRFGGEEFTLILPEVESDIGMQRAQSILSATEQMEVSQHGVPLGRITISIGIAAYPKDGSTSASLLEAADKALYHAKTGGRNRLWPEFVNAG